jgi:predicted DNA-binding helix-hairpin-helix protein
VSLTLEFYRRNYIEGLFLSSGIIKSPDDTMRDMVRIVRTLRQDHDFRGYIHLKTIPGADPALVRRRASTPTACPSTSSCRLPNQSLPPTFAPEKDARHNPQAHGRPPPAREASKDSTIQGTPAPSSSRPASPPR